MIRGQPALSWLWHVSRRVVTHHQRREFELRLADVQTHFQVLARTPASVPRHLGSPFAPDKNKDAPQPQTQDAKSTWKQLVVEDTFGPQQKRVRH